MQFLLNKLLLCCIRIACCIRYCYFLWPEVWFVTELATFFNTKLCVIFGFLRLQRLCPVLSSESWMAIALPRLRKTDKKISSRQHRNLSNLCSGSQKFANYSSLFIWNAIMLCIE
ncbi:hypothetical protein T09_15607 [Trichinella sp. T9]|nr:hypothetical protein T09_15607 [Trichinella sp. T9]